MQYQWIGQWQDWQPIGDVDAVAGHDEFVQLLAVDDVQRVICDELGGVARSEGG